MGGKWVSRGSRLTDMSEEENCARKNCQFGVKGVTKSDKCYGVKQSSHHI